MARRIRRTGLTAGLATVLMLAVMVSVGAAAASAQTSVCDQNATPVNSTCTTYATTVDGTNNGSGTLSIPGGITITCTGSTFTDTINPPNPNPLGSVSDTLTNLTYSGCTLSPLGLTCTVSVNTPLPTSITWNPTPPPDGFVTIGNSTTPIQATITCTALGITVATCHFSADSVTGNVFNPNSTSLPAPQVNGEGQLQLLNQPLTGDSDNPSDCGGVGAVGTLNAVYNITGGDGQLAWVEEM